MKISFYNARELEGIKCSIHITGKLGFSEGASRRLKLNEGKSIQIGRNEEDEKDTNLYMKINENLIESAYKINKAGSYYYISTKTLFDKLELDYRNKTIIFDLVQLNTDGESIIKMIKREVPKKKKE